MTFMFHFRVETVSTSLRYISSIQGYQVKTCAWSVGRSFAKCSCQNFQRYLKSRKCLNFDKVQHCFKTPFPLFFHYKNIRLWKLFRVMRSPCLDKCFSSNSSLKIFILDSHCITLYFFIIFSSSGSSTVGFYLPWLATFFFFITLNSSYEKFDVHRLI